MRFKIKTKNLILASLFVALFIVGAFVKIPIGPVPVTLQLMFVMLAGQLLNHKAALAAVLTYIALGVIGLPVFAGGGGVGYLLTPTFGYVIGFLFAAPIISYINSRTKNTFIALLAANVIGILAVYVFGLSYAILISIFYLDKAFVLGGFFLYGFLIFLPTDIVFAVITAFVGKRIRPHLKSV